MKKQSKFHLLDIIPIFILVLLFLIFMIASKGTTVSVYNLKNMVVQVVPVIVGSLGCIFVVTLGGTDISIGASAALFSTLGILISEYTGVWAAIPLTLVFTTLLGFLVGIIVTRFKVSSFMTTLATLIAARGFLNFLLSKQVIYARDELSFVKNFGFSIGLLIGLSGIIWYVFEHTSFGYYCKCIGENERAVRAVGIKVKRIRILCFMISGFMAGIVGIITLCRVGGATSSLCNMLEMRVQMAIFLGGILVTGGFTAKIYKVIIGSVTIIVIENGLTVCQVSSSMSEAIEGILLIAILCMTIYCNNLSHKKAMSMAMEADEKVEIAG